MNPSMHMHDWWLGPGHFFASPWHMIVGMLFWIVVIAGLIYLVARLAQSTERGEHRSESPRELLDRRYAKGEIDKGEYEERKKALQS